MRNLEKFKKKHFPTGFGGGITGFNGTIAKAVEHKLTCYVVYISRGQDPIPIKKWKDFMSYSDEDFDKYCGSLRYCPLYSKDSVKSPPFKNIIIFSTVTVFKCLNETKNEQEFNIAMHMGISKTAMFSPLIIGPGNSPSKTRFSLVLHKLTAEFILKLFPKVKYQINRPLDSMTNIFLEKFKDQNLSDGEKISFTHGVEEDDEAFSKEEFEWDFSLKSLWDTKYDTFYENELAYYSKFEDKNFAYKYLQFDKDKNVKQINSQDVVDKKQQEYSLFLNKRYNGYLTGEYFANDIYSLQKLMEAKKYLFNKLKVSEDISFGRIDDIRIEDQAWNSICSSAPTCYILVIPYKTLSQLKLDGLVSYFEKIDE